MTLLKKLLTKSLINDIITPQLKKLKLLAAGIQHYCCMLAVFFVQNHCTKVGNIIRKCSSI